VSTDLNDESSATDRDEGTTLSVALTATEMARLRAVAAERGLPMTDVVHAAIAHELAGDDGGVRALVTALHDHHLTVVSTCALMAALHDHNLSVVKTTKRTLAEGTTQH